MAQKRLLTNGNAFKRTDDRWCGVVWYMDEQEQRKRKSFSGTTKAEVNKKMTDYIAEFNNQILQSDEAKRTLQESMQHWLQVFKFPSVERTTFVSDMRLLLTPAEFDFLAYLIQNTGSAVSRKDLLKNLWQLEWQANTRATDDLVKRLRRKLRDINSPVRIETVWGYGFRLAMDVEV